MKARRLGLGILSSLAVIALLAKYAAQAKAGDRRAGC